jgi:hypothetical protein
MQEETKIDWSKVREIIESKDGTAESMMTLLEDELTPEGLLSFAFLYIEPQTASVEELLSQMRERGHVRSARDGMGFAIPLDALEVALSFAEIVEDMAGLNADN